jgi:hypothetical protein
MSRSIANDHRATQTRPLPLILPMPRSSHWVVTAPSPWVAVDPVFGAQCVAFYRSVRFTLLALIAFLAGPRTMRAGRTERATEIGSLTRLPQPQANSSASEQSARRTFPRSFSCKAGHNDHANGATALAADTPRREMLQLTVERTHAPPAQSSRIASCLFCKFLPNLSVAGRMAFIVDVPKRDSFYLLIKRTHAPPAGSPPAALQYTSLDRFVQLSLPSLLIPHKSLARTTFFDPSAFAVDVPRLKTPPHAIKRAHAPPAPYRSGQFSSLSFDRAWLSPRSLDGLSNGTLPPGKAENFSYSSSDRAYPATATFRPKPDRPVSPLPPTFLPTTLVSSTAQKCAAAVANRSVFSNLPAFPLRSTFQHQENSDVRF